LPLPAADVPRPRLIHLNGPPGIGKSTIARRYAADHPGVLNLDVDRLRSFIGGVGFLEAGEIVRPLGAALMTTHLAGGRDVVYPQLASDPAEVAGVERATRDGGGEYVGIVLMADQDASVRRFQERPDDPATPWLDEVREIVEGLGGDDALRDYHQALLDLATSRADTVITAREGQVEATYASLLEALGH
jgi:predicted kinase